MKYRPFCSKRCADIDLGNWFTEQYTVEAVDLDEQEVEELTTALEEQQRDYDYTIKKACICRLFCYLYQANPQV